MLFSIIVPVYNVGPYVSDCLKSIEEQSCKDFELIVVIDKTSSDDSEKNVLEYKRKYDNLQIVYQDHKGLGAARNYGMKFARGDYIIFIDSDDCMDDTHYLEELALIIKQKCPDYVVTRSKKYVGIRKVGGEVGGTWGSDITENPLPRDAMIKVLNSGYFGVSAWAKAIRRDFCIANNLQFVEGFSEDFVWTSTIINLTDKYAFVNSTGITHYIRSGSLSEVHSYRQVADLGKRIIDWKNKISEESEFGRAQLGYLAYNYYIFIADLHFTNKNEQRKLWVIEKEIRILRKYGVSKKCKYSNILCSILGIKAGSYILYQYVKRKKSS